MKKIETLKVDKLMIKVERKPIKNMYLKVKPNREITISAPINTPSTQIIHFIETKKSWIEQKQKEFQPIPIKTETTKSSEALKIGQLTIKVERKAIKNMYLKVKPNGDIIVSAHPDIPSTQILDFIKRKQSWLEQKQAKIQQLPSQNLKEDEILFLGKPLKYIQKWGNHFEVELHKDLLIYTPKRLPREKIFQHIEPWLLKELQNKINVYYNQYWPIFEKLGFQPIEIKYRNMKTTWGVCRPTKGTITFSKQLIHQPAIFIEYVVVHELCHLLHPNHSAQFYEAVTTLLPEWKEAVKQKV